MAVFRIPLLPAAQRFTTTLSGVTYQLTLRWNVRSACWVMDLADSDGNPIRSGVPLVTGCDLFGQFEYLDLGGAFVVQTSSSPDEVPTLTNLGSEGNLFFVTPAAAA